MKTYKNEQLELFPEQPKQVKELLQAIERHEQNIEAAKRHYETSVGAFRDLKNNTRWKLQEVCIHPEIKVEDDHDYHNNIWWEEHICTTCDKMIKRI